MKKLLLVLLGGSLLASSALAQGINELSAQEFRQTLYDYLKATDAYRSTNYAELVQYVPDATMAQWTKAVPNGRQFQAAVNEVRARLLAPRRPGSSPTGMAKSANASPIHTPARSRFALSSSPGAGIDTTPLPDYNLFNPVYTSGGSWASMTSTLQGVSLLPGGDVSDKRCDPSGKAALSLIVSTFHAVKDLADQICAAIPDPVVIVLGEGTRIPAKEVCYGINLIIGAFNSAADGLFGDCETADGLVDYSQIEATYNNTIALYNLEFRLAVEENLGNTLNLIGMFEVPNSQGGYLEQVRAITADIVNNLNVTGVPVASAQAALLQGDTFYNSHLYKQAYKQYQKAYGLAVQ